jgi:prepilin-type N-terminal cleavage/methylation domain-containing protein
VDRYRGFTLVEVIVSFAILAIVLAAVTTGFIAATNISAQTQRTTTNAEALESNIAGGIEPTNITDLAGFSLNGFLLPSAAATYTEGGRRHTVLEGTDLPNASVLYFGYGLTAPELTPNKTAAGGGSGWVFTPESYATWTGSDGTVGSTEGRTTLNDLTAFYNVYTKYHLTGAYTTQGSYSTGGGFIRITYLGPA